MRLQRQGLRPRHPHGETRDSPAKPGSSGLSGLAPSWRGPAPNGPGHRRERAKGILLAVAATPFVAVAVVHCAGNAPDPKVGQGEPSAVASSAATTASATATDSAPPALTASGPASGSASSTASSTPQSTASGSAAPVASGGSVLGDTWSRTFPTGAGAQGKCGDLARAHAAFLEAHRGCKTSSECVSVNASCGLAGVCGAPMNSAHRAGLSAKDKAFTDANCMAILAAPCPSCASRGAPACVAGKCEFVR